MPTTLNTEEWPAEDIEFNKFVLGRLCMVGYKPCVDASRLVFTEWRNDSNTTKVAFIKSIVFSTIARFGEVDEWEYMYARVIRPQDLSMYQLWFTSRSMHMRKMLIEQFFPPGEEAVLKSTTVLNTLHAASKENLPGEKST